MQRQPLQRWKNILVRLTLPNYMGQLYDQRATKDRMPSNPSMGFVSDTERYNFLHNIISEICHAASVPRINYEFYAWNTNH